MRIDLHTHSTASDGTESPAEVMRSAAAAGLDVVALTDHDTTAGWAEAVAALLPGLSLVRGMEMSCEGRGEDGRPVAVHLLAYLFDPENVAFARERERLRSERTSRLQAMARRMAADGLPIDPEAVMAAAGPAVGRPHLARALVEAGVVGSVNEAFTDLLRIGGRYYVHKEDTPLPDAVRMVSQAGGVSVLAHPRASSRGRMMAMEQIGELVADGLSGLEIEHHDHREEDTRLLADIAHRLDLIVTGSSDYHGVNKSVVIGEFLTAPDQFDRIVASATGVPVVVG
ncbi:PHP domain-containing protein [Rhodococcus spelaei]|uniref:PHP domain-containing protein n=1 Tax=Rhodococcus spelaei TaxID=2546320 RepID=A0A541AZQ2_9NOCA|nr:PHP domain-containing protein [Rhodococcus spelaei]TQF65551.1 PHP domain-containing protein [Rhodococcus spelaei]